MDAILITGINSGMGFATAKNLLEQGYTIIGTVRDETKAKDVQERLNAIGNGKLNVYEMDLASLQSVKSCAEKIREKHQQLDILIFNAGMMTPPYGITEDGFESQFQVNYLSHFYLFSLLQELAIKK